MAKLNSSQKKRIKWWQEARFGMFIHWGLYTIDGLDCWKMFDMGIPVKEYIEKYEPRFNPKKFDAKALAKVAKNAGCKYIVMGTRHHEGYCLWNTKTTKFSCVCMTPKRDFIKEYVKAARKVGLRVGLYYSLLDWRYKAYWDGPRKNPQVWKKFVSYVHAQVKELMTQYGKIDILWYDGAWPSDYWDFKPTDEQVAQAWRSKQLNSMVRQLQPNILINNRSYPMSGGDFGTPEQKITPEHRPWELCDTMGELWGAAPQDLNRKSTREILTRLITCVSLSGNMLLNIGPNPDGSIQAWQAKIMTEIGEWLKKYGEAIYGCVGEWQKPFNNGLTLWDTTRKGNILYLHLLHYPGESFSIANYYHNYWFISAEILTTRKKLKIIHQPTRDIITGLPKKSPDTLVTVIRIKIRQNTRKEQKVKRIIALNNPGCILF